MITEEYFNEQLNRLKARFGDRAFDPEFTVLVAKEVKQMDAADWVELVSFLIGSRTPSRPPLLSDFRDGRLAIEKRRFNKTVADASRVITHPAQGGGLKRFLTLNYPGAKSLWDAVEVERLRIRIARVNGEGK